MNVAAWVYLSRTLEAGLLAAFVVLMLGLLLCARRVYQLRSLRAGHEHRLAMMAAGAVATAQRDRHPPYSRFESIRDADGVLSLDDLDPCDECAFYDYDDGEPVGVRA